MAYCKTNFHSRHSWVTAEFFVRRGASPQKAPHKEKKDTPHGFFCLLWGGGRASAYSCPPPVGAHRDIIKICSWISWRLCSTVACVHIERHIMAGYVDVDNIRGISNIVAYHSVNRTQGVSDSRYNNQPGMCSCSLNAEYNINCNQLLLLEKT